MLTRLAEALRRAGGNSALAATLEKLPDNDVEFARSLADLPVVNGLFLTRDSYRDQAEPKAGFGWSGNEPNAILAQYSNAVLPLPTIAQASSGLGVLTIKGDSDGIIRRAPLLAREGGKVMPSLSLEALRVAQGGAVELIMSRCA